MHNAHDAAAAMAAMPVCVFVRLLELSNEHVAICFDIKWDGKLQPDTHAHHASSTSCMQVHTHTHNKWVWRIQINTLEGNTIPFEVVFFIGHVSNFINRTIKYSLSITLIWNNRPIRNQTEL